MHRNQKRRFLCAVLAVVMTLTTILPCVGSLTQIKAQGATSTAPYANEGKKIISVVYDDSYSMIRTGNWCYANYAFQLFTSLCEDVDDYYVTYMSNPKYSDSPLGDNKSMSTIVENIRTTNSTASATPMQSVETAYTKLKSVESTDAKDEYWLVVMSDGVFDADKVTGGRDLYSRLENYSKEQMPNGTKVHSIYLNIGTDVAMNNNSSSSTNQIYIEQANSNEQIISALVNVAKIIFGYIEVENVNFASYELTGSNSMKFRTKLSLEKLLVICNKSSSDVSQVKEVTKERANEVNNIELRYPVRNNLKTDESLIGSTNTTRLDGNLATAEYDVTFSEAVENENVRVLVKPNLAMQITLFQTGESEAIKDYSTIKQSDRLDITCKVIDTVSGREVHPSEIANDYTYQLAALNNGNVLAQDSTTRINNTAMALKFVDINASLLFNGNNYIDNAIVIEPIPFVIYKVEGYTDNNNKYSVAELAGNNVLVHYIVYGNGERLSRKDIQDLNIKFYPVDKSFLYKMRKNSKNDGDIEVSARFGRNNALYKMLFLWLPTWVFEKPSISVAADLTSPYTGEHVVCVVDVSMRRGPLWRTIFNILWPICLLLIIIGFVFKKRFPSGAKIAYCFLKLENNHVYAYKYEWETRHFERIFKRIVNEYVTWRTFVPFVAESFKFEGGVIYADSFGWSRNPHIRVQYQSKHHVRKAYLLDTKSISSNEDVNFNLNTSRVIEIYDNDNEVCLYLREGVIFVLDDDARFYKFSN